MSQRRPERKRVEILYFVAGGGHRATAEALEAGLARRRPDVDVVLTDYTQVKAELDLLLRFTGRQGEDIYDALILKRDWRWVYPLLLRAMRRNIAAQMAPALAITERHFAETRPDLVVVVFPHMNAVLGAAAARVLPGVPVVSVMTDLADHDGFWLDPPLPVHIVGTQRAEQQALRAGVQPDAVHRVSGMVVHPRFDDPPAIDRAAARQALGLHPDHPTGLVFFGAGGSSHMPRIARALDAIDDDLQLVFLCGRAERVADRLRRRTGRHRTVVEGYTDRVVHFMQLSDFFIGKCGPGSLTEALTVGLPAIVSDRTMPHEAFNPRWLRAQGAGLVVSRWDDVAQAVRALLRPGALDRWRRRVAGRTSTGRAEVVELLCGFLG